MINELELRERVQTLRNMHCEISEVMDFVLDSEVETITKWNTPHCAECREAFPCVTILVLNGDYVIEDESD